MRKIFFVLITSIILLQTGCVSKKEQLSALWFYIFSTSEGQGDNRKLTPANFIDLRSDGTYTRDFGKFDYGRWESEGNSILLTNQKTEKIIFSITILKSKDMQLQIGDGVIANFESRPGGFASNSLNPFSVENNQWRIAAIKKESEDQIKKRLRNHCKFYEIYFRWALDKELKSLDVRSTASAIKIYGNGFSLKELSELSDSWRTYFYDEDDCIKANTILKTIFEQNDIAWANTDNKYKMFISAFQQLQEFLK
jgi:hypothetical protein